MNIWGMSLAELQALVRQYDAPAYRGRQVYDYLYRRGVHTFADMAQLPQALREQLAATQRIDFPTIVSEQLSADKRTAKVLLRYADDALVESVLMHYNYGYSVCVSTQVGCAVGCRFCASGQNGLIRNLTAAEMLAQVYAFQFLRDMRIHSFVLMGSGEPLQNYDEVLRFMRRCADPEGLNLSYRNMTLSTSGIVPGIYRLAEEQLPITLALSLHAPNDTIRNELMPISRQYPLAEVMAAVRHYRERTKRRVTCEYVLIREVNDRPEHARELAALLRHMRCHVNLIPLNENPTVPLRRPEAARIETFLQILTGEGIQATVRKEMGREIQAACGQLKMKFLAKQRPI